MSNGIERNRITANESTSEQAWRGAMRSERGFARGATGGHRLSVALKSESLILGVGNER
jgi:hypothetical protein